MTEHNAFERRVDVLEIRVETIENALTDTRTIASISDRDASEIREVLKGHTNVLNALREDHLVQRKTLSDVAQVVGSLVAGQNELRVDNERIRVQIDTLSTGQASLRSYVAKLAVSQAELRGDVTELRGEFTELRGQVGDLATGQAELRGEVSELRGQFGEVVAGQAEILRRLDMMQPSKN